MVDNFYAVNFRLQVMTRWLVFVMRKLGERIAKLIPDSLGKSSKVVSVNGDNG